MEIRVQTNEKVISHRPFSMFMTVGVNTSIDRSQGRRITL